MPFTSRTPTARRRRQDCRASPRNGEHGGLGQGGGDDPGDAASGLRAWVHAGLGRQRPRVPAPDRHRGSQTRAHRAPPPPRHIGCGSIASARRCRPISRPTGRAGRWSAATRSPWGRTCLPAWECRATPRPRPPGRGSTGHRDGYPAGAAASAASASAAASTSASAATTGAVAGWRGEIVLHAAAGATVRGAWTIEPDGSAAGGSLVRHADAGAPKVAAASATPANYFELTFAAAAGTPYRVWLRGRADRNGWANDSVFLQFSGAVDQAGAARWRIGTTQGMEVNLEDCSGCGVAGWGWQDTGYGANVLGPLVYFAVSGPQTIRIQTREDGLAIDQIVFSAARYLQAAPGSLTNDATVLRADRRRDHAVAAASSGRARRACSLGAPGRGQRRAPPDRRGSMPDRRPPSL